MKYRGIVCEKCGVEVTLVQGAARAHGPHRAGLAGGPYLVPEVPAVRIGMMLDMTLQDLERVLYFEQYIVVDPA